MTRLAKRLSTTLARWRADLRGATLVQFIAVLPVFILVIIGTWALFEVYWTHQHLCEAVWEASRYLQVEGPAFDEDISYPDGWEQIASEIVETELRSNRMFDLVPVTPDEVEISPGSARRPNKEMSEVRREEVRSDWFFVQVTKQITNPIGFLLPDVEDDNLQISCKQTGFYEHRPIGPTSGPGGGGRNRPCRPVPPCTAGPPPTATDEGPNDPTPDPCPVCEP